MTDYTKLARTLSNDYLLSELSLENTVIQVMRSEIESLQSLVEKQKADNLKMVGIINELEAKLAAQSPTSHQAGREVPVAPDNCPVSGRKFWGNLSHPEMGYVATYGGPFDTYTIPEIGDDGELRCERYDQDAGEWVEGGEPFGWFYKDQQAPTSAAPPTALELMKSYSDGKQWALEEAAKVCQYQLSLTGSAKAINAITDCIASIQTIAR